MRLRQPLAQQHCGVLSVAMTKPTNTVIGIASGSTTTLSAIDAVGNRVATGSGGAVGFLLPDLHGNTAGALNSTCTSITDAFAYDAESGARA
jgi:hypothetical protein